MATPFHRVLVLLGLITAPAAAQQRGSGFAILPFENGGSYGQDKEVFQSLELGLPAMLARALEAQGGVAADPTRLSDALRRQNLGSGQRIDAGAAAEVARGLEARYAVTGTFADFYGRFRLNARLVDARDGRILKVVSNENPRLQDRAQLAAIVQTVADQLAAAAGTASGGQSAPPPVPTDAITLYSRGLLHESQGDQAGAADLYRKAITAFPGFAEPQRALDRIQSR